LLPPAANCIRRVGRRPYHRYPVCAASPPSLPPPTGPRSPPPPTHRPAVAVAAAATIEGLAKVRSRACQIAVPSTKQPSTIPPLLRLRVLRCPRARCHRLPPPPSPALPPLSLNPRVLPHSLPVPPSSHLRPLPCQRLPEGKGPLSPYQTKHTTTSYSDSTTRI
jgi:hypothetical protein